MRNPVCALLLLSSVGCIPRLYSEAGPVGQWEWVAPENRWPLTEPPEGTSGEGWEPGQVVPDVRVQDQFGEEVSLWQFHGQVVLFDISTMWCAPCRELAQETEATSAEYAGEPFTYITVLQEDVEAAPPSTEDLSLWAETYGITSPVIGDGEKQTAGAIQAGQYPAVLVIGPDLMVRERVNPPADAEVRRAISEALE